MTTQKHRSTLAAGLQNSEAGSTLPFAILALLLGVMLIGPTLSHVGVGLKGTEQVEANLGQQYCSDAGIEYALWRVTNDPALRDALISSLGQTMPLTMTVAHTVNDEIPSVELVCVTSESEGDDGGDDGGGDDGEGDDGGGGGEPGDCTETLEWVIWAHSTSRTNTVQISGSGHRVNGNVHSNNKIKISGSGSSIVGIVEYVTSISVVGSGHYFIPGAPDNPVQAEVGDYPISWNMADFAPGGKYALAADALGEYHHYTDRLSISGAGTVLEPGLYYCEDDVSISGSGVTGENVTIVSLEKINISGSGHTYTPYIDGLTFFTTKSAVNTVLDMSGSGNAGGTAFAPNGKIALTGSGGTITGAFIGDRVDIAGSGATINLATVYLPCDEGETEDPEDPTDPTPTPTSEPSTATCSVFDIRSICNGTTTLVRVSLCTGEEPVILSWHLE